jgi:hypothetical protein
MITPEEDHTVATTFAVYRLFIRDLLVIIFGQ